MKKREVPDIWKMDMSQILDSSSSEDDDDEEKESEEEEEEDEEEKKKKKHIKEEVRVGFTALSMDTCRFFFYTLVLCAAGGGVRPRGEGPLPAAAVQIHGGQR